jgi:hypothetical protein
MMMRLSMEICVSVSVFPIELVGQGVIREARYKNIEEGEGVVLFHFHVINSSSDARKINES